MVSDKPNIVFTKGELKSSRKKIIDKLAPHIDCLKHSFGVYTEEEILSHVLSKIRADFASQQRYNFASNDSLIELSVSKRPNYILELNRVEEWIKNRLIPYTVTLNLEEKDLLKLLTFSLAIPYKMFKGESKATATELVRRTKSRDFQQIFSDHFIGRLGEVSFKHFAKDKFKKKIILDWSISQELQTFKSDIRNSKRTVSIKSTSTLESVWAEAPRTAEYGIFVKVSIPQDFFIKILAHISSLRKLLDYLKQKLSLKEMSDLLNYIEEQAFENKFLVKAFIVGFFKTSSYDIVKKGEKLLYLGEVEEDKYFVPYSMLEHSVDQRKEFFCACKI